MFVGSSIKSILLCRVYVIKNSVTTDSSSDRIQRALDDKRENVCDLLDKHVNM